MALACFSDFIDRHPRRLPGGSSAYLASMKAAAGRRPKLMAQNGLCEPLDTPIKT